jgi:hypothetical protein
MAKRTWTDEELRAALRADMQLRFRTKVTHLSRVRRRNAAAAAAAEEAAKRRRRKHGDRWTEKEPGRLRKIREQLRTGDVSGLSAAARQQLASIGARPDVSRWIQRTSAKAAHLEVDRDQARRLFHRWVVRLARRTADPSIAAREAEKRIADETYVDLEVALIADELEQERILEQQPAVAVDVYAVLSDALRDEESNERRRASRRGLDGPYVRLRTIPGGLGP